MRLKSLEMVGFKSFADKTVVHFPRGMTGVVGPNGCGKSNIVDAMMWVLGEQSAKGLRGASMDDVIFSGTSTRTSADLAEVHLTFDTEGGGFAEDYMKFSEVTISRYLDREGNSGYFINRTPCRLRDVMELFMDTGVGTRAYSIIKQGKISEIINSKPEEMRVLFEEAAGIHKYKSRKKAAQRKMEATRGNLMRVEDIIREITRQMNSLKRQANKAERYRARKGELKDVDLTLATRQFDEKTRERAEIEQRLDETRRREDSLVTEGAAREAALEEARLRSLEAEKNSAMPKARQGPSMKRCGAWKAK